VRRTTRGVRAKNGLRLVVLRRDDDADHQRPPVANGEKLKLTAASLDEVRTDWAEVRTLGTAA
jgi:hypothetical protein